MVKAFFIKYITLECRKPVDYIHQHIDAEKYNIFVEGPWRNNTKNTRQLYTDQQLL
jgi:hypothetical protein